MAVMRYVDGELVEVPDDPRPTLAVRRPALLEKLAMRRWQAETGAFTFGAVTLALDSETTNKLDAAYLKATRNPAFTAQWKVENGVFVTLDADTIIALGDAVTDHVQDCFANEAAITAQILGANTHAALDAVDIENGWPG